MHPEGEESERVQKEGPDGGGAGGSGGGGGVGDGDGGGGAGDGGGDGKCGGVENGCTSQVSEPTSVAQATAQPVTAGNGQ